MKKLLLLTIINLLFLTSVKSQKTYVPDDNFENALRWLGYDTGALDDSVTTTNINTITFLDLFNKNINDLTGIEDFVALDSLYCRNNNIDSLDLSNNLALKVVDCSLNNITNLDLPNSTTLEWLTCNRNNLNHIDLSGVTNLIQLRIDENTLDSLDLSILTALEYLDCEINNLTSLKLPNTSALEYLDCGHNNLTDLDLSNNSWLKYLDCSSNNISSLYLINKTFLKIIHCDYNNITSLDFSNDTALQKAYFNNNYNLTDLYLNNGFNNNITRIESRSCTNLTCAQVDDTIYSNANWNTISIYFDSHINFSESCFKPCQAKFHTTQLTAGGVYLIDSTLGNKLKYKWYFGDGDSSNLYLPTHNYTSAGSYNLCLQITDTIGGCSDFFCDTITVDSTGVLRNSWTLTVVKSVPYLSIEENSTENLKVYPNPTVGVLNIEFENEGTYCLFSIDGKQILQNGILQSKKTSLDISSLRTGMYLLRVITDKGNVITKRVIKQ